MTDSRDPDRLIHHFLLEGEEQLHDQVYDAVRAEVEQKRQRVVIGPWRTPTMNRFLSIGLGAAAVVVALLVGVQLLGSPNNVGSGGESTPTPEATVTEPSPLVAWRPLPQEECVPGTPRTGELEAGTYRAAIGAFSVTMSVPTGWNGGGDRDSFKVFSIPCLFAGGVSLAASLVSQVYSTACDGQGTAVETGTPAAVTAALAAQTGYQTTGPSDTTIAGYPASRFEFSVPGGAESCNAGPLWLTPGGGEGPTMGWSEDSGSFVTVYVVDVDGSALGIAIDSGTPDEAADVAELDAIVASLQIEP
ncbi:MAG: hypothetical protein ACR2I5_07895 [Candidatus Limnocylindria bacterium]